MHLGAIFAGQLDTELGRWPSSDCWEVSISLDRTMQCWLGPDESDYRTGGFGQISRVYRDLAMAGVRPFKAQHPTAHEPNSRRS